MMNWLKKLSQSAIRVDLNEYPQKLRDYLYNMSDRSFERGDKDPYTREEADQDIARLIQSTQQNMQKIVVLIEKSIANIPQWGNSSVVVKAAHPPTESLFFGPDYLQAVEDAYIEVGEQMAWGGIPNFTLFMHEDGTLQIDDVLEAGDSDFFVSGPEQSDYFSLIREMRNPGSSAKGKILTLYTARPMKDRELYEGATTIPVNLFLTSNYANARHIGMEIPGENKIRDIWRVKIDERFLTLVLDTPMEKHYQVTGPGNQVPVQYIKLVDPGE